MKVRWFRILGGILSAAAVGGGIHLKFDPGFEILKINRNSSSQTLSITSQDLANLYTAETFWDMVFPHDFFPSQGEWKNFLAKQRKNQPLEPKEWEWAQLQNLCRQIGFSPSPGGTKFLALRVVVKAGFDLSSPLAENQGESDTPLLRREEDSVVVSSPPVSILKILLEDPRRETYPFPDTSLTPEQLRLITGYVARVAEKRAQGPLLEKARKTGRALITRLLEDAGIQAVRFE